MFNNYRNWHASCKPCCLKRRHKALARKKKSSKGRRHKMKKYIVEREIPGLENLTPQELQAITRK